MYIIGQIRVKTCADLKNKSFRLFEVWGGEPNLIKDVTMSNRIALLFLFIV